MKNSHHLIGFKGQTISLIVGYPLLLAKVNRGITPE